ncbi:hypothetical protein ACHZ98_32280 [Streptomyces sp. MAR4 CNY-716]
MTQAVSGHVLTEGERAFVDRVAEYYFKNDGMSHDRGRVIGWLMICEPPQQRASELVETLQTPRETVDRIVEQLTPLLNEEGVFGREGALTDEDYTVWLRENRWAQTVEGIFASMPALHAILQQGVAALEGASEERRRRVENMERFVGYLSDEVPKMMARHAQRAQARSAD